MRDGIYLQVDPAPTQDISQREAHLYLGDGLYAAVRNQDRQVAPVAVD
jgi:hypothetical protein